MAQQKQQPTQQQNKVKEINVYRAIIKNLIMGGTAGLIGATIVYPLDMAKTRLQNQVVVKGKPPMYKNLVDVIVKMAQKEGLAGLYRGLPAQWLGIAPEKAIKLTTNDMLRYYWTNKQTGEIKVIHEMAAGALAGFSQVIVTNPYEFVKVRLQTATIQGQAKSITDVLKEVGVRGLFTGAGACLLRDVPFSAVYFTLFGNLKRVAADENGHLGIGKLFVCGTIAGTISAGTVTPADVVKTRLQTQKPGSAQYSGIVDCFTRIYKEEGMRALFKGTIPRILIISPLFGITLATYEVLKGHFEDF